MANVYVYSGAAGAGTGADWANAYTTLPAALAAKAAGDTFFVAHDHAETAASAKAMTSPGTSVSPCRIICVDRGGSVPPVSADLRTTATVTSTVAAAASISFAGTAYSYGVSYRAGSGSSNSSLSWQSSSAWFWVVEAATLQLNTTSTSPRISFGPASNSAASGIRLINTVLSFGSASQGVIARVRMEWYSTASAIGGTVPTSLFLQSSTPYADVLVQGVDLSAAGSGNSLVNATVSGDSKYLFLDCKLGASVAITTGSVAAQGGARVRAVNCDSADTNYRYYDLDYPGTITHETTIVRTGGASDGTTSFSRKFVTTANASLHFPLYGPWFYFWNETIGSVTGAIETVTDNVTVKDTECWVEVEALTNSGFPYGSFASDRAADTLATGANQPSSSETWTTTGLTTPVTQTMSKAVTVAEAGWVRCRLVLAKASTTVYACPKVLSTSATQYMDSEGNVVNMPAAGSGGPIGHGNMNGGTQ